MYKDNNKTFSTRGNESIDKVLTMMENVGVLSDLFKQRIVGLAGWILMNSKDHEVEINDEIVQLARDMHWMTIFNNSFTKQLKSLLLKGLNFELNKKEDEEDK